MSRYLPIALGVLLIVGTTLLQGTWSERWGEFPELQRFADQLQKVPMDIGSWKGEARPEPTKKVLQVAGATGSLSREYTNENGDRVSLFIVCGRLQDIFFHQPNLCYTAAGFEMHDSVPVQQEFTYGDGEKAEFFSQRFIKTDANGKQDQLVYWSFDGNGEWVAPEEHKWTFAGQRALYKIYLIISPQQNDNLKKTQVAEFIPVLLPELNKAFEDAIHPKGHSTQTTSDQATQDASDAPQS